MWYVRALKIVGNFLLALMICLPIAAIPSEKTVKAETWTVNTSEDAHDLDITDGECNTTMGSHICTLRAAIEQAYQYDIINFSEGMIGATIYLHYDLESLILRMNHVTIDGSDRNITVSGELMSHEIGADTECLRIGENYNTVQYLTFRDCAGWGITVGEGDYGDNNTINGVTLLGNVGGIAFNEDDGDGFGGNHNYVQYSMIGSTSSSPSSCIVADENVTGIAFSQWVHGNHIEHSSILCNGLDGIDIYNADTNYIHGNTISGNGWNGTYMYDSSYITITENDIGDMLGVASFGNGQNGIKVEGASHDITIGGASLADGNIISGNAQSGIFITGTSNKIAINNNVIGINAYLDDAIPNGNAGVAIINNTVASGTGNEIVIGDDTWTTLHQYISGNSREGIYIENSNKVRIKDSNLIGRGNFSTSDVAIGNGLEGVRIIRGTNINVGGYAIAYNGAAGVAVEDMDSSGVLINPQRVYNNGGLPIDLGNNGHTANDFNDEDKGPNTLLNYPEVKTISGGYLYGVACPNCVVYLYLAKRDPSMPMGGAVEFSVSSILANSSGDWQVAYPVSGHTIDEISMLAIDPDNNTSELSPRPVVLSFIPLLKK